MPDPDRLARSYAYQMLVLDELERLGCKVQFTDAPAIDDDPQARLLTQMQGVIAEYERAKIAERYRRGKLYRVRAGEAIFWKVPYGYRRVPRTAEAQPAWRSTSPRRQIVRGIFDDIVVRGSSVRAISRRLYEDGVASPSGREVWATSTLVGAGPQPQLHGLGRVVPPRDGRARQLRDEPRPSDNCAPRRTGSACRSRRSSPRRRSRPRSASSATTRCSAHGAPPRHCGCCAGWSTAAACGVKAHAQQMRSSAEGGTRKNRYYSCSYHDTLRAGGRRSALHRAADPRRRARRVRVRPSARDPAAPRRATRRRARARRRRADPRRRAARRPARPPHAPPRARQPPSAAGSPTSTKPVTST